VLQVYLGSNTLEFSAAHRLKFYLAIKREVEAFRDQGFVLPEVESLRIQSLWLLKKALPSREEPNISSLSIINSKAHFYTHALRVYY